MTDRRDRNRLAARHSGVAVDLGTGDGRSVLGAASERPDRLIVDLDASAAGMGRGLASRGGQPAVLASVAQVPPPRG